MAKHRCMDEYGWIWMDVSMHPCVNAAIASLTSEETNAREGGHLSGAWIHSFCPDGRLSDASRSLNKCIGLHFLGIHSRESTTQCPVTSLDARMCTIHKHEVQFDQYYTFLKHAIASVGFRCK